MKKLKKIIKKNKYKIKMKRFYLRISKLLSKQGIVVMQRKLKTMNFEIRNFSY
jgi:hypothetical protein